MYIPQNSTPIVEPLLELAYGGFDRGIASGLGISGNILHYRTPGLFYFYVSVR